MQLKWALAMRWSDAKCQNGRDGEKSRWMRPRRDSENDVRKAGLWIDDWHAKMAAHIGVLIYMYTLMRVTQKWRNESFLSYIFLLYRTKKKKLGGVVHAKQNGGRKRAHWRWWSIHIPTSVWGTQNESFFLKMTIASYGGYRTDDFRLFGFHIP